MYRIVPKHIDLSMLEMDEGLDLFEVSKMKWLEGRGIYSRAVVTSSVISTQI